MPTSTSSVRIIPVAATLGLTLACFLTAAAQPAPVLHPSTMPATGTVSDRFQSYNIEMVEVTGGRFWKPFDKQVEALLASQKAASESHSGQPAGMNPSLFQYRPPIDLSNPRLRKLAAALGPAYLRVSGTWQNSTYFQDSDAPAPATPPKGFNGVLTRQQWKGVIEFSQAADAKIVSSFATSAGTRDASGLWTPGQASQWLAYTHSIGGEIAATEFMNEPTFAAMGGAPQNYDAAAYARDVAVFVPFLRKSLPHTILLGPGSVGEGIDLAPGNNMHLIRTEDMLAATGPVFDAFSYHFYGTISQRCATSMGSSAGTTPQAALSEDWLSRTDTVEAFYASLRDRFLPGKPLWLTETAQAACGGDSWAATFIDTFRYLNQLGTLARHNVQVVAHNTLAASDYGLLDQTTLSPRPDYWAALLWHTLMGTTVLNPGIPSTPTLRVYAHCLRNAPGGVALLVLNTSRTTPQTLAVPANSSRYTLTAHDLLDKTVQLNDATLQLGSNDSLPPLTAAPTKSGPLTLPAASITFLAIQDAANPSCSR